MDLHNLMEHQFSINVTGKESGKKYTGEFTYRRLSLRAHAEADKLKVRLNGPLPENLTKGTLGLHEILSQLKYGLIAAPEWWAKSGDELPGYDLFDANVIAAISKEVNDFEGKVLKEIYGVDEGEGKAKADKPNKA